MCTSIESSYPTLYDGRQRLLEYVRVQKVLVGKHLNPCSIPTHLDIMDNIVR